MPAGVSSGFVGHHVRAAAPAAAARSARSSPVRVFGCGAGALTRAPPRSPASRAWAPDARPRARAAAAGRRILGAEIVRDDEVQPEDVGLPVVRRDADSLDEKEARVVLEREEELLDVRVAALDGEGQREALHAVAVVHRVPDLARDEPGLLREAVDVLDQRREPLLARPEDVPVEGLEVLLDGPQASSVAFTLAAAAAAWSPLRRELGAGRLEGAEARVVEAVIRHEDRDPPEEDQGERRDHRRARSPGGRAQTPAGGAVEPRAHRAQGARPDGRGGRDRARAHRAAPRAAGRPSTSR